ncbi:MAG: transcription initiation factor IIB [Promethearchaeota archaeon]
MEVSLHKLKKSNLSFNLGSLMCPDCHSMNVIIDHARGENICANCGLVISEHMIDRSREGRRSFSMDEKSKRDHTGSPVNSLLPDLGLTTIIDKNGQLSQRMKRIIKWNSRMSWKNRNLLIATTEIKRIGGLLNLPLRTKEFGAKIYRKALKSHLLRGRSIKAMTVASLYYACRAGNIPRTLLEILKFTDCNPRDVRRCYRTLIQELGLNVPNLDPILLIPKYITALDLNNAIEASAVKIIKKYNQKYNIAGRDPKGILAGAIYVACLLHHETRSQSVIAKIIQVTEVTLRSRYKEIIRFVKIPLL